jgi:glycosyltransferase involved in cell wall biosynthesis
MDGLARELGVRPQLLPMLGRKLSPKDLVALLQLTLLVRSLRPHIIHTHAAKAGALGRIASLLAGDAGRTVRLHTFHGHVLSDYFSPLVTKAFRRIERALARHTSKLIAVSDEVRDDLIRLGVARPDKIVVVPLGFDLGRFDLSSDAHAHARRRIRARWGVPLEATVVVLVARLVAIKRVDRFLRIANRLAVETDARFVVVGDGELHAELKSSDEALALGDRLVWAGLEVDMPAVMAAADVVALTSDNEGTPVSLIEAQAAGRPVVSTGVGGVASVVLNGQSGYVVTRRDEAAFADRVKTLLDDEELAAALGRTGREVVLERFSLDRLVRDMDALYRELVGRPAR